MASKNCKFSRFVKWRVEKVRYGTYISADKIQTLQILVGVGWLYWGWLHFGRFTSRILSIICIMMYYKILCNVWTYGVYYISVPHHSHLSLIGTVRL
jgi:hypothetical protein